MYFKDYSFVDEETKRINIGKLVREETKVAELLMLGGLAETFLRTLDSIRENVENNKSYSQDIEVFKEYIEAMIDMETSIVDNGTNALSIIDIMTLFVNQPDIGEKLAKMDYRDYFRSTRELEKSINSFLDLKRTELTEKERDTYYDVRNELIAVCSTPVYFYPNNCINISFSKDGVLVNGKESSVNLNDVYTGDRKRIFKELDIDKMLEEDFGETNSIRRMLLKRKIDPAVLTVISLSEIGDPRLTLMRADLKSNEHMAENDEKNKKQLIKKYISQVTGRDIKYSEEIVDAEVNIEYNVKDYENRPLRRYAKASSGKKGVYIFGDLRSKFEKFKDAIFAKKIPESDIEIVTNSIKTKAKNESLDINFNTIVDAFELDLGAAQVTDSKKTDEKSDATIEEI